MKIVFFCELLEPGRSGVGDYTLWLAKACTELGHTCALVGFKDPFIKTKHCTKDLENIPCLRFQNAWESTQSINTLNTWLHQQKPDWISLQFVPYSFHPKGIIHKLPRNWSALMMSTPLHMMFHEIWIGSEGAHAPLKSRIYGPIQKYFVKKFLTQFKPQCIHTHTPLYKEKLEALGAKPIILPLFSNIVPTIENANAWLFPYLQKQGININNHNHHEFWLCGIFGSIHPSWPTEPLTTYLQEAAAKHKKTIILLSIGHPGAGEALWTQWAAKNHDHLKWNKLGSLPEDRIAKLFQSLDFGIATSQYQLLSKSCSVISMLECGLPVIVNRLNGTPEKPFHPLIIPMTPQLAQQLATLQRGPLDWTLPQVASQFIEDLYPCQ